MLSLYMPRLLKSVCGPLRKKNLSRGQSLSSLGQDGEIRGRGNWGNGGSKDVFGSPNAIW